MYRSNCVKHFLLPVPPEVVVSNGLSVNIFVYISVCRSYLKIKPVDDNTYPSNCVKILVRMTLGEFVINLSKAMDQNETPYLMFRVNRLRIDSALTAFGYGVHATLGGIQLVDKIHTGNESQVYTGNESQVYTGNECQVYTGN